MKKLSLLLLLLAPCSFGQSLTRVTGTLTDPNSVPYYPAHVQACLTTSSSIQPTASGTTLTPNAPLNSSLQTNYCAAPVTTDSSGRFAMSLVPNSAITPSGSQYTFTVQTAGTPPPAGKGAQTFTSAAVTVSGATQDVSTSINSVGPAQLNAGGGVSTTSSIPGQPGLTAVPVTSGLMAEYRILPGETCGALIDYSGSGNNATGSVGTPPAVTAVTGGIAGAGTGACSLPAALNSAQTIQLFIGNPVGNANGALVAGNGTTTSSLILSLTVFPGPSLTQGGQTDQAFTSGSRIFSGWMEGGNNLTFQPRAMIEGNIDVAWVMVCDAPHASNDTMYINGVDQNGFGQTSSNAWFAQRCSQGHQTTGNYQLGGIAGGSNPNYNSNGYMNANIYYALFYNRPLNAAEVARNSAYLKMVMYNRGVTPTIFPGTPGLVTSNPILAVDGDSLSCGSCIGTTPAITSPYSAYLTLNTQGGNTWNITNMGRAGYRLDTTLNPFGPQAIDPIYRPYAPSNTVVIWGGTNDASTDFIPQLSSYCQARHAVGWKCIVVSMISRTGLDANKNSNNALIRQLWPTFADGFADIAADVNLGADGANGSATYFTTDHVHVTDVGIINDETPWIQRAINRLYGNRDFSTATVYGSAAAAAVATTAGSEATNTVTLTSAATPANCLKGNMVTVAGTTPAGYSGNWLIRTSNGTQITYFAATAGMGAITVQGTLVCPQSQDADQYAVLNFTGNHTLDSCVGYTGQRLYRRNINAGAVTLVPFASETITGAGATPTTLAANTTAILESQLVSAAAAGCNWIRLQ